jgi:capsular polysaccharide biosynthesis protein
MIGTSTDIPPKLAEQEHELDLVDVIRFIYSNLATLAICTILGIGCGIAVANYIPNKWETEVTLQIGKVPFLKGLEYIDPPAQVAEKIKSPLFLSKIIWRIYGKDIDPDSPEADLLYKDLKVAVVKDVNLVTIHVFGRSPEAAYRNAGILAETVIEEHHTMSEPYLAAAKKRLAEVDAALARNRMVSSKVDKIEQSRASGENGTTLVQLALIDAKARENEKLHMDQTELEALLSVSHVQQTKVVGRTLVPRVPSSPKRGLLFVVGAFAGLMLGLVVSFGAAIRRASHSPKSEPLTKLRE